MCGSIVILASYLVYSASSLDILSHVLKMVNKMEKSRSHVEVDMPTFMVQDEIWYGAVSGGSTFGFFEKSEHGTHEKLYNFMSGSPAHTF